MDIYRITTYVDVDTGEISYKSFKNRDKAYKNVGASTIKLNRLGGLCYITQIEQKLINKQFKLWE